VLADAKAGSTVMVWVDGSGQLTGLPLQRATVDQATLSLAFDLCQPAIGEVRSAAWQEA